MGFAFWSGGGPGPTLSDLWLLDGLLLAAAGLVVHAPLPAHQVTRVMHRRSGDNHHFRPAGWLTGWLADDWVCRHALLLHTRNKQIAFPPPPAVSNQLPGIPFPFAFLLTIPLADRGRGEFSNHQNQKMHVLTRIPPEKNRHFPRKVGR